jgi:hypothetical protein
VSDWGREFSLGSNIVEKGGQKIGRNITEGQFLSEIFFHTVTSMGSNISPSQNLERFLFKNKGER